MLKKLTSRRNSYALIIKQGKTLATKKKPSIKKIAKKIMEEYADLFEKLAK